MGLDRLTPTMARDLIAEADRTYERNLKEAEEVRSFKYRCVISRIMPEADVSDYDEPVVEGRGNYNYEVDDADDADVEAMD